MEENTQNVTPEHASINIPEKLLEVMTTKEPLRTHSDRQKMPKVPELLRQEKNAQQDYDPRVVSIGPYHHGKEELKVVEDFKKKALKLFVEDCGKEVPFLYKEVYEEVNEARKCYIVGSTSQYDDPTFAQMILLDACFIINYVVANTINLRIFYVTRDSLGDMIFSLILHDLFLLENQIPFWILKKLICSRFDEEFGKQILDLFLNITVYSEYHLSEIASSAKKQPVHLLDACRLILVPESGTTESETTESGNFSKSCCNLVKKIASKWGGQGNEEYGALDYVYCFRSASELKARGIHFRPSVGNSLMSVNFNSWSLFATLEVPKAFVTTYTKGFLLNMIAYELCLSASNKHLVSAYVDFMKALINNPKDVKELREKEILLSTLENDEDVVKVYKDIKTYGFADDSMFNDVKKKIQAYHKKKAKPKTWFSELLNTYFSSPWKVIALLVATFLILLSFLQTYFTIYPTNK